MITIRGIALALACWVAACAAHAAGVSAGYNHSLALSADGTVRAWGDDSWGALGLGRSLTTPRPVPVAGISNVTQIAAGGEYTAVLRSDGTVWTWGRNDSGQLGDGSTVSRSVPGQVVGLTQVVQISAGRFHMMARRADGSVWTWGSNNFGEQGDDEPQRGTPTQVANLPAVVEVAAGAYHSLARTAEGIVWAWGQNDNGQLGDGTITEPYRGRSRPTPVTGLDNVVQVSAGGFHSVALRNDGTVWAWGNNRGGEVGDASAAEMRSIPTRVSGLEGVAGISAGYEHTAARRNDGSVWAWGNGGNGQLGDGFFEARRFPVRIELAGVTRLASGFLHSLALANDGGLWAWGNNTSGAVGDPTEDFYVTPVRVDGASGLAAVAVGMSHSVALRQDGTLLVWGDNSWGQLGNGALTFRSVPSVVSGLPAIAAVSAGGASSYALTAQATVLEWGNLVGWGVGPSSPRPVPGLAGVTAISAGGYHVVAILADRTLRAWGGNYRGILGNPGYPDGTTEPVPIPGLTDVTRVSAGNSHTLALRGDGTVWAWGENDYGQLGDGSTTDRGSPVQVPGIANAVAVAAGPQHSLALLADGGVLAWGRNYEGALGQGNEPMRIAPMRVPNLPPASAIAAGGDFSVAVVAGSVWVWGVNYNGGIGCRACDGRAGPSRIAGLDRVASVSAMASHVVAMREDGAVYSWGGNRVGQLGDGTLVDRDYPVVVLREGGAGSVAGNDWFLDLAPAVPTQIAVDDVPSFLVVASTVDSGVVADIRPRQQDVGSSASTFVFAMAPTTVIRGALKHGDARFHWKARTADGKTSHVQCALAQLNAQGQLVAVSAESLRAFVSGVLTAQGQSVNVLNAITPDVKGATFFVGYGPNGNAMLTNGTTRGVVSVSGEVNCKPQSPQTGWWYNPAEGGRGFSIEARGNRLFFGAFHYDTAGNAVWNYAGGATSLDGSLFSSEFIATSGGQTLTGPYRPPSFAVAGSVTLAFSDATHGTISWPGGTTAIERLPFVPNGLTAPAQNGVPEAGWWWNPSESGRGFFLEWQNGYFHIAGYMYDDSGRPRWYLSAYESPDPMRIAGNWWLFGNGQAPGQPYRPAQRIDDNAGALEVQFTSSTAGTLTLPDGRRVPFVRMAF